MRRKRVRLGVSRFQAGTEAPSTNQEIHGRRTSACKGLDVHLYIERQDVVHQLVLARESSTAPVPAPEYGWPHERVSGKVWRAEAGTNGAEKHRDLSLTLDRFW